MAVRSADCDSSCVARRNNVSIEAAGTPLGSGGNKGEAIRERSELEAKHKKWRSSQLMRLQQQQQSHCFLTAF